MIKLKTIERNGVKIAIINRGDKVICDVNSALDLLATSNCKTASTRIVIDKKNVIDDFFALSTVMAGTFCKNLQHIRQKLQ